MASRVIGNLDAAPSWVQSLTSSYNATSNMFEDLNKKSEQNALNSRLEQISAADKEAGGNLYAINPDLYSDPVGMQAMGEYTKRKLATQQGVEQVITNNRQAIINQVDWISNQFEAAKSQMDNPQAFSNIMSDLAKGVNVPYNYNVRPDGMLEEVYQGQGQPQPTGRVFKPQEVYDKYVPLVQNKPEMARMLATVATANALRNADYKADPNKWLFAHDEKTGQKLTIVPQYMPGQNNIGMQLMYTILEDGKGARAYTAAELQQLHGITPMQLNDYYKKQSAEKGLAIQDERLRLLRQRGAGGGGGGGQVLAAAIENEQVGGEADVFRDKKGKLPIDANGQILWTAAFKNNSEYFAAAMAERGIVRQRGLWGRMIVNEDGEEVFKPVPAKEMQAIFNQIVPPIKRTQAGGKQGAGQGKNGDFLNLGEVKKAQKGQKQGQAQGGKKGEVDLTPLAKDQGKKQKQAQGDVGILGGVIHDTILRRFTPEA